MEQKPIFPMMYIAQPKMPISEVKMQAVYRSKKKVSQVKEDRVTDGEIQAAKEINEKQTKKEQEVVS